MGNVQDRSVSYQSSWNVAAVFMLYTGSSPPPGGGSTQQILCVLSIDREKCCQDSPRHHDGKVGGAPSCWYHMSSSPYSWPAVGAVGSWSTLRYTATDTVPSKKSGPTIPLDDTPHQTKSPRKVTVLSIWKFEFSEDQCTQIRFTVPFSLNVVSSVQSCRETVHPHPPSSKSIHKTQVRGQNLLSTPPPPIARFNPTWLSLVELLVGFDVQHKAINTSRFQQEIERSCAAISAATLVTTCQSTVPWS
jgi:hypothetical protein